MPALVRLLGSAVLESLQLSGVGVRVLDTPEMALLVPALHANRSLTRLGMCFSMIIDEAANATALLGALTAHPCLTDLNLSERYDAEFVAAAALGPALGALLAADSALERLAILNCMLDDALLHPLVAALPHNTRLRSLDIRGNRMSAAFARDVLLPAVSANHSLRQLIGP